MNERGARPYCKQPVECVAGTRGKCRLCHATRSQRNARIVAYHGNGARTFKAVADKFGITPQRIRKILIALGVTGRKEPHRSHDDLTAEQRRHLRNLVANGIPAAVAHIEVRR